LSGSNGPNGSQGPRGQNERNEKNEKDDARDEDVDRMLSLARGDESAFDVLFSRWSGRLQGYLERMLSDGPIAEDLVQETFLRVYRARQTYRPESRFSTWLYRIATNLALNELRRPHRRRPHASTDDEDRSIRLTSHFPRPDAVAHARLVSTGLEAALESLPERQRMALWLAAVEGHSYAEVAASLATTEKSVKSLVHRARATLAVRLPDASAGTPTEPRGESACTARHERSDGAAQAGRQAERRKE
jgi:RNA polymerase sigma-70 factor (ECF subfamily)